MIMKVENKPYKGIEKYKEDNSVGQSCENLKFLLYSSCFFSFFSTYLFPHLFFFGFHSFFNVVLSFLFLLLEFGSECNFPKASVDG